MTFLTNKSVGVLKNVNCKVSGFSFDELDQLEIPEQVVVDVAREYSTRALQQIIRHFGCKYIESPIELNSKNVIYIIQEGQQNILKIEAL